MHILTGSAFQQLEVILHGMVSSQIYLAARPALLSRINHINSLESQATHSLSAVHLRTAWQQSVWHDGGHRSMLAALQVLLIWWAQVQFVVSGLRQYFPPVWTARH